MRLLDLSRPLSLALLALPAAAQLAEPSILGADTDAGDRFGFSVATDGATVVVGAHSDGDGGYAHVYEEVLGVWTHVAALESPGTDNGWFCGAKDSNGEGEAFGYTRVGGAWTGGQALVAPGLSFGDDFGEGVALGGGRALVGAVRVDDAGGNAGAVYAFSVAGWAYQQTLQPAGLAADDMLGDELAIDGDVAVLGAWQADEVASDSGAAWVYEYSGGSWVEVAKLLPHDGGSGDLFGFSVDVDGERVLVGAERWGGDAGRAYLFARADGSWPLVSSFHDGSNGDGRFGHAVSLDGDRAAIAEWGEDSGGAASGEVVPFSLDTTLYGGLDGLRVATGGTQPLGIAPGTDHAGELFLLLGTLSGTAPGLPLGAHTLPPNVDAYTNHVLANPNAAPLPTSFGFVPASGVVGASFVLPAGAPPSLAGLTAHHAYVLFDGLTAEVTLASDAVPVDLLN